MRKRLTYCQLKFYNLHMVLYGDIFIDGGNIEGTMVECEVDRCDTDLKDKLLPC